MQDVSQSIWSKDVYTQCGAAAFISKLLFSFGMSCFLTFVNHEPGKESRPRKDRSENGCKRQAKR
eukprot:4263488-Amphidinium_carterae.1